MLLSWIRTLRFPAKFIINMKNSAKVSDLLATQSDINNIIKHMKKEAEELRLLIEQQVTFKAVQEENKILEIEVQKCINELIQLETKNGKNQISSDANSSHLASFKSAASSTSTENKSTASITDDNQSKPSQGQSKEVKAKVKEPKAAAPKKSDPADSAPVDVGRLDFRVGRIVDVKKHPDADSLYVEQIDIGQDKPITVVSGLVKHVPIEEMSNRLVVLLCNLKPAKMRGITSEAMVMCASTPEKVEILAPPPESLPGDLVHVEGYPRVPDAQLNPKKKIFETVAPDLLTNTKKLATYKGALWTVPGKGPVTSQSLVNVNIK